MLIGSAVITFVLGLLYANALEWLIHKYLLHGRGRNRASLWSFHWHEHHKAARQGHMLDEHYLLHGFGWNAKTKEITGLVLGALATLPLVLVAPWFALGAIVSSANYYRVHKKAHLDPAWALKNLPWHVDHHLGPNQDANWCVTYPFFDWVMGTREKYLGTQKHRDDVTRASSSERSAAA